MLQVFPEIECVISLSHADPGASDSLVLLPSTASSVWMDTL